MGESGRSSIRVIATLVVLLYSQSLPAQETGKANPAFPQFKAHLVARLPGGYKVAAVDVDRDGKPDVIGLATTPSCLAWYKNPTWERYILTSGAREFIDLAPQDIDGDGRIDLAIADEFGMSRTNAGGLVHWLQCPEDPTQEWPMHAIGTEPTSHRLRWADIDGDGHKELVVAPIMGRNAKAPLWDVGVKLAFYRIPAPPTAEPWKPIIIDDRLTVLHGLSIVDWDRDGRGDILTASFEGVYLHRSQGQGDTISWTRTRLGSGEQTDPAKRGASEIALGRLRNRPRGFLAAIEPWHGDKVAVYTPRATADGLWQRTVIDATFNEGHALLCADLDGDREDEIIAGYRGQGASLYLYDCRDSLGKKWERIALDEGDMAASGLDSADVNGDGRLDIIAVGTATANIKWYENLGSGQTK
ncbi:MAG: VCBS repeat-containing protein [Planctomycetes bacterium]|nr:VCBS repeat-containing protein [Planctomycetota bacterium]